MKTQVIHIDSHDDFISIRDRMEWAKTPRILLVWPKRGRVEMRPLDLTLLRRHAESLGAELGLVTRQRQIRAAARELGISYFSTASEAQKKKWLEHQPAHPVRRFPRLDLRAARRKLPGPELFAIGSDPILRVAIFSAGVLAVLAIMLVFIPSAQIRITLPEEKQSFNISVSAEPDAQHVQLSGVVPARKLTLAVAGENSALASGKAVQPVDTAAGEVLLMNLTDKAVSVPAGTVLLASPDPTVSFVTDKQAQVPAGKGKNTTVSVRASAAGLSGNVPPGTVTIFEGPLGLSLAVTNPASLSGGTENPVAIATAQDRDNLKKRLLTDLDRQARQQFAGQISSGDVLLPSTFVQLRVVDEVFTPAAGQAGEKLSLKLSAEYAMAYASFADLQLLAGRVLDASLPAGTIPASGLVNLKVNSALTEGQGVVRWQMFAERSVRPYTDSGQVISVVLGKTARRAASQLTETYGLAQSPQIKISPSWWPWLPFLPIRITVTG